jgi:hypothetical protein
VNVEVVEYSMARNVEQLMRYVAGFIGKYIEIDMSVKRKIANCIARRWKKDLSCEKQRVVVLCWRVLERGI